MRRAVRPLRFALAALAGLIGLAGAGAAGLLVLLAQVPVDPALELPDQRSFAVHDADGQRVAVRGVARARAGGLDRLPQPLADAVVAIEDRRFYEHFGLDLRGIARAAWVNVTAGEIAQGGSTITQQLARLRSLSNARTWTRKLQEAALALRLDAQLSKDEILRRYLQRVYFGAGTHGATAAARRYFDTDVHDLSVAQAALLAGLIRAPSRLSPVTDLEAARARATRVLDAMVATGRLDPAAAEAARANPATPVRPPGQAQPGAYFSDWAAGRAAGKLGGAYGHFDLHTTLEPELQRLLHARVRQALAETGTADLQAAAVAIRPDGAVAALLGGRSHADSPFNRAVQARRQPGSLFKLFVYAAALDAGLGPDATVRDAPVEIDGWSPQNYTGDHRGPVPLRTAFAQSINVAAVRLSERVGRGPVIRAARRLGLRSELPDVPSLALGTAEVSPLEIAGAYAAVAFGDGGLRPAALRRIDSAGATLYRRAPPGDAEPVAAAPGTRAALLDLLRRTVTHGTGQAAAVEGLRVHGKTGTSQQRRDAWFVGFARDLTLAVWVGRDDAGPTQVTGGGLPARIFAEVMAGARDAGLLQPGDPDADARQTAAAAVDADGAADSAPEPDGRSRATSSADRAPEPEPDPPAPDTAAGPPAELRGPARVIDTATLAVDGRRVRLYGVARGSRRFAGQMADYIGDRRVTCSRVRGQAYRCRVDGYDLSEVVLYNGGARARDGAPRALQQAEARARREGLGVWRR